MTAHSQNRPADTTRLRRIAALLGLEAASLALASLLHLSGLVHGHGGPFSSMGAGIAEAVICVALLWAASALIRDGAAGRRVALGATGFAIAGFIFGLNITVRGGDLPDIAYHATVLPILVVTFVLLLHTRGQRSGGTQASRPTGQATRH
jgi:hypothetical protein